MSRMPRPPVRRLRLAALLLAGSALTACASFPALQTTVTGPARFDPVTGEVIEPPIEGADERLMDELNIPGTRVVRPSQPEITPEQIATLVVDEPVGVTLPPQTVPELANAAFGDILRVPFALGPGVASRTDVVALRGSPQMSKPAFFRLVQTALRDYGVKLYLENGSVRVMDDFSGSSATAVIRSREGTPSAARTVIQFFEVQTIDAGALLQLAQGLFPNNGVTITVDQPSNALVLRGGPREVAQTAGVLREIDQSRFAGRQVLRVQPIYFSAANLQAALRDVLSAEGYQVSVTAAAPLPIILLALPEANQLLVFASDPALLDRVSFWIEELDQPSRFGATTTTFVYEVQNTDAQTLGALATGQQPEQFQPQSPVGVPGTAPSRASGSNAGDRIVFLPGQSGQGGDGGPVIPSAQQFLGGRLLIDPVGNRILFTGTANDYAQLRTLLTTLDEPAKQVLIEVTIAEVTLNDETRVGLNFFFTESWSDGVLTGGTRPGLDLGSGGLNLDFTGMDLRAAFNAFASNNKVNILQRPRLVARSGGVGRIQVGDDVPIITSQRAANSQTGGDTDILQTVQYRQTGSILEIEPVVYGDSRIDLIISQEVSNVTDGGAGSAIASPIISSRSLQTQLSLAEGQTAVLGGLNGNSYSKGNSGIPFLKDIPFLGSAFRTDVISGDKTELVILVTPFIIRDPADMALFANQASDSMNRAYRVGRGWSYTLTPFSGGPGIGLNLPRPDPAVTRPVEPEPAPAA